MKIYDNLNAFLDSCYEENKDLTMIDIFYNYEYFTNLTCAYIVNENLSIKDEAIKLYRDPKPTFGVIFNRFRIIYNMDENIKNRIEDIPSKRFLNNVRRFHLELSEFNIENEIDISKLNDESVHIVIINLLKVVVYLRNKYLHERMLILDILGPSLESIYMDLIMLTNTLEVNNKSEFIKEENGEVLFLNTVVPSHTYKNKNYSSVIDVNSKRDLDTILLENRDIVYEEIFVKDIPFIKIPSGTIRFKSYDSEEFIDYYVDGFCISKYPITNKQYTDFLKKDKEYAMKRYKNPNFMKDYRNIDFKKQSMYNDCAVYFVDWIDSINYCNYLSEDNGYSNVYKEKTPQLGVNGFRLPTELEWYYAATCGKGIDAKLPNLDKVVSRYNRGINGKVEVNTNLYENDWKISGMLGNINEWTNSTSKKLSIKKFEIENKVKDRRIIKGGSFASDKRMIKYDYSTDVNIDNMHYIGLRIVINNI